MTLTRLRLRFSTEEKKFPSWEAGQPWGLRLYQPGHDNGLLFSVRLKVEPIQISPILSWCRENLLTPLFKSLPERLPGPTLLARAAPLRLALRDLILKMIKTRYLK